MLWRKNDGGRAQAGYKGTTGDCVVRAIAIASGQPYDWVYHECKERMVDRAHAMRKGKKRDKALKKASPRFGVPRDVYQPLLEELGFEWTPTMQVGGGCQVHMEADELPHGRLVVRLSRHLCAVVNGIAYDIYDPTRGGTRCVYGHFKQTRKGERNNG